jgi:hypothetical protein
MKKKLERYSDKYSIFITEALLIKVAEGLKKFFNEIHMSAFHPLQFCEISTHSPKLLGYLIPTNMVASISRSQIHSGNLSRVYQQMMF